MTMKTKYAFVLGAATMITWGNAGSYQSMRRALQKGYRGQEAEMMADCENLTMIEYPFIIPGRQIAKFVYNRNHP